MTEEEKYKESVAKANEALKPSPEEWWATQLRDLEEVTSGLARDDPRGYFVRQGIGDCIDAYNATNLRYFEPAARYVKRLMRIVQGAMIAFEGTDGEPQFRRIDSVHFDDVELLLLAFVTLPDGSHVAVDTTFAVIFPNDSLAKIPNSHPHA